MTRTTATAALAILAIVPLAVLTPAHAGEATATEITDESDLLGGPGAVGQIGDFLLANDEIAVVIQGVGHMHGEALSGGNIVDMGSTPTWSDELGLIFTLLGEWPRQAVYDTVRLENDGSAGTEAALLARGVDSEDASVAVTTRYTLADGDRHITIETTIKSNGANKEAYEAGDSIDWGYTRHFAPGFGFDLDGESTGTEWIAGGGAGTSYGYTIDALSLNAVHGASWSDATILETDIPSGGSASYERFFACGEPDLAAATDVLHVVRGTPTGLLLGTVSDEVSAEPVEGAAIDCGVTEFIPYTQAIVDADGSFRATLPPEVYHIEASAEEYIGDDTEAYVAQAETARVDFVLVPYSSFPPQGDTLTVVMRPILSVPEITTPGESFTIEAAAPPTTTSWEASLQRNGISHTLTIASSEYSTDHERWYLAADVPSVVPAELYDLVVVASEGVSDTVAHAVMVRESIEDDFYFVHVTDTHLPTHRYHYQSGADKDTSEMVDFREVINDINIINPAFVLHTGDLVNEGELEYYLGRRYYTKAQRILKELEVPVYVVAGNHDIGGWDSTPPPDGSARRTWWSFFGWRHLYDPPGSDPIYTQNYTFDYSDVHFIGLEAYDNYDSWRYSVYGGESFTNRQMEWLANEVASIDPVTPTVLFYHYDFGHELDLAGLGIDCTLWGHIHSTSGSIASPPFNLSTDALCDGRRTMRVVRVSGDEIIPSKPIRAGGSGELLTLDFDGPNDGSRSTLTATAANDYNQDFEHAMVRFHVRADSVPYAVDIGELKETIIDGSIATCYVGVPLAADSTVVVTIRPCPGLPDDYGEVALLRQNHPNPAHSGTTIEFVLPFRAQARLEIVDVAGRRVRTLVDGETLEAGPNERTWDLSDRSGHKVASGIYFYRLEAGEDLITRKMVVAKD